MKTGVVVVLCDGVCVSRKSGCSWKIPQLNFHYCFPVIPLSLITPPRGVDLAISPVSVRSPTTYSSSLAAPGNRH